MYLRSGVILLLQSDRLDDGAKELAENPGCESVAHVSVHCPILPIMAVLLVDAPFRALRLGTLRTLSQIS